MNAPRPTISMSDTVEVSPVLSYWVSTVLMPEGNYETRIFEDRDIKSLGRRVTISDRRLATYGTDPTMVVTHNELLCGHHCAVAAIRYMAGLPGA